MNCQQVLVFKQHLNLWPRTLSMWWQWCWCRCVGEINSVIIIFWISSLLGRLTLFLFSLLSLNSTCSFNFCFSSFTVWSLDISLQCHHHLYFTKKDQKGICEPFKSSWNGHWSEKFWLYLADISCLECPRCCPGQQDGNRRVGENCTASLTKQRDTTLVRDAKLFTVFFSSSQMTMWLRQHYDDWPRPAGHFIKYLLRPK